MKDRNIYCLNAISEKGKAVLRSGYNFTEDYSEANGVLVRSADMHEMELPDSLRAIARAGAGVNNIPLDKCAEKGIVVFNTPGANANAVKELVVAALIMASRDIYGGISWVKANAEDANIAKSAEKAKKAFAGTELFGKSLGVIGLGAIGILVANVAESLGMKVYGYDPFISVGAAWSLKRDINHTESLDELFSECDYITIHVPATPTTKGMIDADAIGKMKDGVRVLNFARDTLVDNAAMAEALKSGKVSRYMVDFPTPETVALEGAIITPHIGASTEEAEENCAIMAARELQDYLDNGNIIHSVNYPDCEAGICRTESRIVCLHKNVPGMLGKITAVMSEENINIENMVNRSRGAYAVTLMDISTRITDEALGRIQNTDGMNRVRIVK